jgi:hypothetical protein
MPTPQTVERGLEHRLVLPDWGLRSVVRQLAAHPATVWGGVVRIRTTAVAREYLLERVAEIPRPPGPRGQGALVCWCLFTGTPAEARDGSLADWVRQQGWSPEQWLVVVQLDARRPGWWEGMVWTGDGGTPLTHIHPVAGPLPVLQQSDDRPVHVAPPSPPDQANLTQANLTQANLTRANLTRANLTRPNSARAPQTTTAETEATEPSAAGMKPATQNAPPTAATAFAATAADTPGTAARQGEPAEPAVGAAVDSASGSFSGSSAGAASAARGWRDSRTRGALGERVADRLRTATVTLVGAGRNGTQMAQQLAALGVGRLRILDPDHLAPENLDGAPGLAEGDVGRTKVEALARLLHAYRSELTLALSGRSTRERAGVDFLAERSDLLVTCVDDDLPRLLVGLLARQTLTPHLDVGTRVVRQGERWELTGDARLLLPTRGCVVCVGGLADLPAVVRDLHLPAGALLTRTRQPWHGQRAGSLVTINAMTVGAGVQLWLDLLAGGVRQSHWQRLAWRWGTGLQADGGGVTAEPGCRLCEQGALPTGPVAGEVRSSSR